MRTTVRIDDVLLRQLKEEAARTGRTVSALVEEAIRERLARRSGPTPDVSPLPTYGGSGTMPGVDLASAAALREVMDGDDPLDALR